MAEGLSRLSGKRDYLQRLVFRNLFAPVAVLQAQRLPAFPTRMNFAGVAHLAPTRLFDLVPGLRPLHFDGETYLPPHLQRYIAALTFLQVHFLVLFFAIFQLLALYARAAAPAITVPATIAGTRYCAGFEPAIFCLEACISVNRSAITRSCLVCRCCRCH